MAMNGVIEKILNGRIPGLAARRSEGQQLTLRVEKQGDAAILHLSGRLVIGLSHVVEAPFAKAVRGEGRRIIVNLTGCPYLDTSGIAILVANLKRARIAGKEFVLACVGAHVFAVLRTTRLLSVFDVFPSVEAALESSAPADGADVAEGYAPIDGGGSR